MNSLRSLITDQHGVFFTGQKHH